MKGDLERGPQKEPINGYIIYSTYRIIDEKAVIYLFGRLENNESFLAMCPFRPYFFIKKTDQTKAKKAFATEFEETKFKDFDNHDVIKVILNKPTEVSEVRKIYGDEGIICYEADIRFSQRFLIDKNIFGTAGISGEYKKGNYVDRIYEHAKVKPTETEDEKIKLRILSIDIETSYDAGEVYSIAHYTDKIKEVLIVSDKKLTDAKTFHSEKELLEAFSKRVQEIDPDIITGWNVVDFDLVVLQKRFKHYNIPFHLGRADWEGKLRVEESFFKDSSVDFPGRLVLDGITLLKMSFIDLPDYKLDTAAQEFLGDKKIHIENLRDNISKIFKNNPEKLVEYNIKDAELVYKILQKKKLIELTLKKALITGMQMDKVKGSVASLDSLYLRKARQHGYVCPMSSFGEREERVKGAFVMQPKPGIYDYVIVLDFKSLYPSIIRTFNIDPISHKKIGTIVAPNGARFMNDEGILPEIIKELGNERDIAKKEKDDIKSFALKTIMNSFYGVLANPMCRFYNLEMANAITSFGREIVQETAKLIEKKGYHVIYGDTDSVFVDTKTENIEKAKQIGEEIEAYINTHFKDKVKKEQKRESHLVLEFEKIYNVFMLPKMRGGEAGAKKRYAGLRMVGKDEKIDITGLEFVRSDWTVLAKNLQMELLDRIFHKKEVHDYIKNLVDEVKKGKHDKELMYRKSIRKNLEFYTKTTPPHVKAARLLPKLDSNIIEYYITVKGPEPIQLLKNKIDYDHYIEKQIKPIADTILSLFGQNFDDFIRLKSQKSLFDY